MWLVIIGEMDADDLTETSRVEMGAKPLWGLPADSDRRSMFVGISRSKRAT